MNTNQNHVIAIDIGGTKTLVGIVDQTGSILVQKRMPTNISLPMKEHIRTCMVLAEQCLDDVDLLLNDMSGVGFSLPGITNSSTGVLVNAPFAGWRNVPVKEYVHEIWADIPIEIDNDVNACAVGECLFGKGRDINNFLWITISTGIGGALVINRQVVSGEQMMAGEIGHMKVEWEQGNLCGCGNRGCLEAHASGTAITKKAKELLKGDWQKSTLQDFLQQHRLEIHSESMAMAAKDGNIEALQLFEWAGYYLGKAFSYAVNLFNPGAIIVGGGVSQSFTLLEPHIKKVLQDSVIGEFNKQVPILHTGLGYEAGLIGAASLIWYSKKGEVDYIEF
ncbi:ROK family protein [Neobacillus sp. DY30]|uniref:ROK family protein n=1 Tax=Neobacillus sp. DY30 TaxID=3047871 RepID=UPI0024BFAB52|nr:ROK family protein [Neobacillus sp. DY30]WHX98103.1 ROK family protein [Neobacillus sp. DY30]